MTPYYERDGIVIYHGDCRDILPALGTFDLVLTDPPYGMRNNSDYTRFTQGAASTGTRSRRKHAPIAGDFEPFDPTPLLAHPAVILWGWNHFAARLPVGSTLVWIKRNDPAFGSFLSDAELAWKKGGHGVYCRRDLSERGGPNVKGQPSPWRHHPNQKPVSLMTWCLGFFPDAARVVDPYMGSGPVALACRDAGRSYVGIEIDERYCEVAARRLEQEVRRAG